MAALTHAIPEHIGPIDPDQEPVYQPLTFILPDLATIDWDRVLVSFDGVSDILLAFIAGQVEPAVVVYDDEPGASLAYLVNPDTLEFVGWQVEAFLAARVKADPALIEMLDHAEVVGLSTDDLRPRYRRSPSEHVRERAGQNSETPGSHQPGSAKRDAMLRLINSNR